MLATGFVSWNHWSTVSLRAIILRNFVQPVVVVAVLFLFFQRPAQALGPCNYGVLGLENAFAPPGFGCCVSGPGQPGQFSVFTSCTNYVTVALSVSGTARWYNASCTLPPNFQGPLNGETCGEDCYSALYDYDFILNGAYTIQDTNGGCGDILVGLGGTNQIVYISVIPLETGEACPATNTVALTIDCVYGAPSFSGTVPGSASIDIFTSASCVVVPDSNDHVIYHASGGWPVCQVTSGSQWKFYANLTCGCPRPGTAYFTLGGTAVYGVDYAFDPASDVQMQGDGTAVANWGTVAEGVTGIIDTLPLSRPNATVIVESYCTCGQPCGPTLDISNPNLPMIANSGVTEGSFHFALLDDPFLFDSYCTVFASTNLVCWTNLGAVPITNGTGFFQDTNYSANNECRFYTAMRGNISGVPIVISDSSESGGSYANFTRESSSSTAGSFADGAFDVNQLSSDFQLPPPPPATIYGIGGLLERIKP